MILSEELSTVLRLIELYENYGPPFAGQHIEVDKEEQCELCSNSAEALLRFIVLFRDTVKCSNCRHSCKMESDDYCSRFESLRED